ncbi:hypothetical protein GE061_017224 [Apolygus lucorum]|uniref:BRO1 domain-containing protein n=1 Tax=Apolygus lucorum TaxID=248454 RepID=A0A8S9XA88_APOLU|nr:hypothetical protein GE061_017224 [Apolygus lucorum]
MWVVVIVHDPHSTMKLLWAAVVVVSLVDAIDKEGFAKKTGFDVLEKKQNVVNLLTYIGNFAKFYLEVAEKVVSVCEQSLPDKPEEFRLIRRPLGDAKQTLHDLGMIPIRQLLLEHKPAAKVKISKEDLEVWQRINEFGYQLAKAGDLLNKSSTNELPLMHYNDRESSKPLAEQKEDYKKAHVMMKYLHLIISSVAQTVYLSKHLPTYLKQHSLIALKTEKGEKAIKTAEENHSRLEKNLYSFSQGYMNALHAMKSMEIKKGNLPVYEHLKNIGLPLAQLSAEIVHLAYGITDPNFTFHSPSEYKKRLESLKDIDVNYQ